VSFSWKFDSNPNGVDKGDSWEGANLKWAASRRGWEDQIAADDPGVGQAVNLAAEQGWDGRAGEADGGRR
jgi:hypothetical protein